MGSTNKRRSHNKNGFQPPASCHFWGFVQAGQPVHIKNSKGELLCIGLQPQLIGCEPTAGKLLGSFRGKILGVFWFDPGETFSEVFWAVEPPVTWFIWPRCRWQDQICKPFRGGIWAMFDVKMHIIFLHQHLQRFFFYVCRSDVWDFFLHVISIYLLVECIKTPWAICSGSIASKKVWPPDFWIFTYCHCSIAVSKWDQFSVEIRWIYEERNGAKHGHWGMCRMKDAL